MTLKAAIELGLLDALTAAADGRQCRGSVLGSLAYKLMLDVDEDYLITWHQLAAAVAGGGPSAFERAHGMPMFECMATNRRYNTLFNQAMSQQSVMAIDKLLERFHGFHGVRRAGRRRRGHRRHTGDDHLPVQAHHWRQLGLAACHISGSNSSGYANNLSVATTEKLYII
uniref:O-methyltransferase C-terminal domain-containing protein n=1 Tax=Oryza punctata TaxID=4537 RepID=A0A0E0KMS9_ORYPU